MQASVNVLRPWESHKQSRQVVFREHVTKVEQELLYRQLLPSRKRVVTQRNMYCAELN
jgi:hypothetical protein